MPSYQFTGDVCQPIVSGQPINNFACTIYYNDITGPTGIVYYDYYGLTTYQATINWCSGLEAKYTYRWDNPTYY